MNTKTMAGWTQTYLYSNKPHRGGYYLLTLLIELISAILRFLVVSLLVFFLLSPLAIFGILSGINKYANADYVTGSMVYFIRDPIKVWIGLSVLIGLILGFGMIIVSLYAMAGFGGGHTFTRFLLGARDMSQREQELYLSLLQEINEIAPKGTMGFSRAYIVDNPLSRTFLIGTTLYVSSGALEDRHALAIIAHEFGQLQRQVGGTIHALRLLVFPLFYAFLRNVRTWSTATKAGVKLPEEISQTDLFFTVSNAILFFFLSLFGGGLGVWVTSPLWAKYFRQEDYIADEFVVACGLRDELIEYLEQNRLFDTAVPYMMGWQPANELRLDRLVVEPPQPRSSQTIAKTKQVKQSDTSPSGATRTVAATTKERQITPETLEKALIAVLQPKQIPSPLSEALADQDIFFLAGVTDGTVDEKQEFLDEFVQLVWVDFVEEQAPRFLNEDERRQLQKLSAESETNALSDQTAIIDFLSDRLRGLDSHVVAHIPKIKRVLIEERLAGMRRQHKAEPKALATIIQAEVLIKHDKWRSAAMLLNGIESSGVSEPATVVLTDEKTATSEAPAVVSQLPPPGKMGGVAATAKERQITPQTLEKALIAVFQPKHAPPSSEALIDQDLFVLLGVSDGTVDEKQEFLDELVQLVWEGFVEEQAPQFLNEDERRKLQELYNGAEVPLLRDEANTVDFLSARIPELDKHLVVNAAKLKRDLTEERIAGEHELNKADPKVLPTIFQIEALIKQDKWRSAAILLNGLRE